MGQVDWWAETDDRTGQWWRMLVIYISPPYLSPYLFSLPLPSTFPLPPNPPCLISSPQNSLYSSVRQCETVEGICAGMVTLPRAALLRAGHFQTCLLSVLWHSCPARSALLCRLLPAHKTVFLCLTLCPNSSSACPCILCLAGIQTVNSDMVCLLVAVSTAVAYWWQVPMAWLCLGGDRAGVTTTFLAGRRQHASCHPHLLYTSPTRQGTHASVCLCAYGVMAGHLACSLYSAQQPL